jgi:hypothetical protein
MTPKVGEAWLCEVWRLPPEIECNGDGPRLEVMKYAGEMDGYRTRTIDCNGTRLQMTDNPVVQLWIPLPDSTFMPGEQIWKIVPIRVLEADGPVKTEVPVPVEVSHA